MHLLAKEIRWRYHRALEAMLLWRGSTSNSQCGSFPGQVLCHVAPQHSKYSLSQQCFLCRSECRHTLVRRDHGVWAYDPIKDLTWSLTFSFCEAAHSWNKTWDQLAADDSSLQKERVVGGCSTRRRNTDSWCLWTLQQQGSPLDHELSAFPKHKLLIYRPSKIYPVLNYL